MVQQKYCACVVQLCFVAFSGLCSLDLDLMLLAFYVSDWFETELGLNNKAWYLERQHRCFCRGCCQKLLNTGKSIIHRCMCLIKINLLNLFREFSYDSRAVLSSFFIHKI